MSRPLGLAVLSAALCAVGLAAPAVAHADGPTLGGIIGTPAFGVRPPTIVGEVRVGSTLTCQAPAVDDGTVSHYWSVVPELVDAGPLLPGQAAPAAPQGTRVGTGPTYAVTADDRDRVLRCEIRVERDDFETARSSTDTDPVALGRAGSYRLLVTGRPRAGKALRLTVRGVPRDVRVTFRWYAAGRPVPGATRSAFRPSAAHVGKRLVVVVSVTRRGYEPARQALALSGRVTR